MNALVAVIYGALVVSSVMYGCLVKRELRGRTYALAALLASLVFHVAVIVVPALTRFAYAWLFFAPTCIVQLFVTPDPVTDARQFMLIVFNAMEEVLPTLIIGSIGNSIVFAGAVVMIRDRMAARRCRKVGEAGRS